MQKSLVKALQILAYMAGERKDYGISEISESLGLNKSNVHEILNTFASFGYVKRNEQTRHYSLSVRFLEMAHHITGRYNFQDLVRDELQSLSDEIGEGAFFGIPDGNNVMYFCAVQPKRAVNAKNVMGLTAPLTCTGVGKAILAFLDRDREEEVLSKPLPKFTENTITSPDDIRQELHKIRENGYSVDNMEHEYGVKCVAVPVFGIGHKLIGAISVSGPSLRFPKNVYQKYAQRLQETAMKLGNVVEL